MKDFKGARAFLLIPVGIARDQDLLDNSKSILLMGEILSMLNVTGEFFMSNAELAKRLKTTPRTIKRYLILLENKGLIKRTNVYADKEKKVLVGRNITAGDTLGTYMSLGWGQARHEGGDTDVTRVVTPTSPKYNKLIDQSNRTTNTSSSSKPSSSDNEIKDPFADDSETDDDEEVITGLIEMFSKEAHVSIPNYQYNHIKNSLLAMDQSDAIDLMYTVVNKVNQGEVQNPIGYLITSIASVKDGEQMAPTKPPIEILLPYLREQIPGCGISDSELNELRRIYPEASFKDVKRVYYEAINKKAMQPISYMVRRLQVLKPTNDPFHLNPQARYSDKRRIEIGTDWNAKQAKLDQQRESERQAYDKVHGTGAYDAKQKAITADLKEKFSKLTNK